MTNYHHAYMQYSMKDYFSDILKGKVRLKLHISCSACSRVIITSGDKSLRLSALVVGGQWSTEVGYERLWSQSNKYSKLLPPNIQTNPSNTTIPCFKYSTKQNSHLREDR